MKLLFVFVAYQRLRKCSHKIFEVWSLCDPHQRAVGTDDREAPAAQFSRRDALAFLAGVSGDIGFSRAWNQNHYANAFTEGKQTNLSVEQVKVWSSSIWLFSTQFYIFSWMTSNLDLMSYEQLIGIPAKISTFPSANCFPKVCCNVSCVILIASRSLLTVYHTWETLLVWWLWSFYDMLG